MLARMQMPQFRPSAMLGVASPPRLPPMQMPQQNQGNPAMGLMGLASMFGPHLRNIQQANIAGNSPAPWGGNADTFDPGYGYSTSPPLFGLWKG